jgi:cAMP-dependent protein kinase regulator
MFYIIKEGQAVCYIKDSTGTDKVVATLDPGKYFGEIALLTSKPRQATVRAQGALALLAINRDTFRRVFGNLDEILKRNIDHYVNITASTI